jgi:hypothetical protein
MLAEGTWENYLNRPLCRRDLICKFVDHGGTYAPAKCKCGILAINIMSLMLMVYIVPILHMGHRHPFKVPRGAKASAQT